MVTHHVAWRPSLRRRDAFVERFFAETGLMRVVNGVINGLMSKRLQAVGNSSGVIIDKPILELLRITAETELEISTDGERLIITPMRSESARERKLARVQERTLLAHERTFRKLAK
jgi:antitoxin MazE